MNAQSLSAAEGLSDRIAAHVAGSRFEHLPATTLAATRRALLDGLGVMLAASGLSPDVAPFIALAGGMPAGSDACVSVLGTGLRTCAPLAALANGAMAHALDYEDAFDAAPVHPDASLLPALIALAQGAAAPVSGREFLTALAVGCDLACRMALCLRRPMEDGGWYPPPILAAYGAAAGCARLLRLDARGVRDALSLMLCQATCPGEIKHSPDTVIRAVREAFPAQAAVLAAQLAAGGVRGFERPLEGTHGFFALYAGGEYAPDELLRGLGEHWRIEELSFKPWPCCRGTHAYIEAVQSLRARHGLTAADIAGVRIAGGAVQRMLCEPLARKRRPQTLIDAKFSLPFTVAAAWLHEDVTLASFTPRTLTDETLLALAARCDWEPRADWGADRAAAGELGVRLHDGRELWASVPQAMGHPSRPLSDARLREKFRDCARSARQPLPVAAIETLADGIANFANCEDAGAALRCEAR
jgi:2-methylcitrate dehydratase PrpD